MQNHGGAQDRLTILNWKAKDQHMRDLKKELKDQFLPTNTAWMAHESLKSLKQSKTVKRLCQRVQLADPRHQGHVRS